MRFRVYRIYSAITLVESKLEDTESLLGVTKRAELRPWGRGGGGGGGGGGRGGVGGVFV